MPSTQPLGGDPQLANRFLLEVDGVEIGVFKSVSGLSVSIDTQDLPEGGENGYIHKLPGRMSWPNLVFKRGVTDGDALFGWINKTSGSGFSSAHNKLTRHTGAVTVIGYDGSRLRSYQLSDVFPVRWTGPTFDAESNAVLEEELEITHHGFVSK